MIDPVTLWRRHQALPRWLRVQWLAPLTVLVAIAGGVLFTLPPGPLCDEGMVLFMEGGCDFGYSNVFFFAKLSPLLVFSVALCLAARRGVVDVGAFVPHFLVAGFLVWRFRSGGYCDLYYSNPNGSIGQMVLEVAAFCFLGLSSLRRLARRPWPRLLLGLALWHLVYVVAFYGWLAVWNHWLWMHTLAVAGTMVVIALAIRGPRRWPIEP